jgi:hypothetical protein
MKKYLRTFKARLMYVYAATLVSNPDVLNLIVAVFKAIIKSNYTPKWLRSILVDAMMKLVSYILVVSMNALGMRPK